MNRKKAIRMSERIRYGKIKTFILWLLVMKRLAPSFPYWANAKGESITRTVNRKIVGDGIVRLDIKKEKLPFFDHIEMSGFNSSHIISYRIDSEGKPEIFKHCAYPSLRLNPNVTSGTFSHNYENINPSLIINGVRLEEKTEFIDIKGKLVFHNSATSDYRVMRSFYPCVYTAGLIENIIVVNTGVREANVRIEIPEYSVLADRRHCFHSQFVSEIALADEDGKFLSGLDTDNKRVVPPGGAAEFNVIYYSKEKGTDNMVDCKLEIKKREEFIADMFSLIRIETPEPIFDYAFSHMVLRGSESIFHTKSGLMHSPGGGVYYGAVWTNDQVEYSTPFFAYSGYGSALKQAINVIRLFASEIDNRNISMSKRKSIPCSIASLGDSVWDLAGDRGDTEMFGYGAARFALTSGNKELAKELFTYVAYAIEFALSRKNGKGVIKSDKDDLEGRFASGKANLYISCITYDLLLSGEMLARDLGKEREAEEYSREALRLKDSIISYFGYRVEDYETFRYFKCNRKLRSWICMPMCVGIFERADETIKALYSDKLYGKSYMKTGSHRQTCWDRSLLFALKGTFCAGYADKGYEILKEYTKARLLGNHAPYAIEAFPEGNRRQLAAESILYARVFTEGILGYRPEGLNSFSITPNLPAHWKFFNVKNFYTLGNVYDININDNQLTVTDVYGTVVKECAVVNGMKITVRIVKGE